MTLYADVEEEVTMGRLAFLIVTVSAFALLLAWITGPIHSY
jgi:hypothetical protein